MWYVIQSWTGQEEETAKECREKIALPGEEVFTMRGERQYRIRGKWVTDYYQLFKGYIFAEISDPEDFRIRLRKTPRMTKIVEFGDEIIPIYPEEEEHLKQLGGEEHIARFSTGYKVGDELMITEGALKGYTGIIKHQDRHHRIVIISIPLMGHMVDVELGLGIVKKASA